MTDVGSAPSNAARVVRHRQRHGATAPDGRLVFPGLDPYRYEPNRLISDGEGRIVEQFRARLEFKRAEAWCAREAARQQQLWADRKTREYEAFAAWSVAQMLARRPLAEFTFGAFVRESGVWSPGQAEPEPDPSAEDAGP